MGDVAFKEFLDQIPVLLFIIFLTLHQTGILIHMAQAIVSQGLKRVWCDQQAAAYENKPSRLSGPSLVTIAHFGKGKNICYLLQVEDLPPF